MTANHDPLDDLLSLNLQEFLPNRLAVLSRLAQSLLASELAQFDMSISHWRIFLCLAKNGPSTVNGIATFTKISQSALSRSITKLDERGFVCKTKNSEDRRLAAISITEDGLNQLNAAITKITATWNALLEEQGVDKTAFLETVNDIITRLGGE
ncbi:hypothetical protein DMX11_06295 [Pseudomonas sp. LB-090624]|uniref:MarR family winged helix-turn-helix transcriptional regulator n=1 Tax=Pseudomonas sp. LB-090624 TaxID=2213079 RepID=UPI000D9FB51A|nr:MarR family winged helix-turn-helix transcriptional regulator [Pseudomonas sp. LB-090624]PYB79468.1 hypothetical protein DMX11_06295 [Pseudomonas sp. LB-090624]